MNTPNPNPLVAAAIRWAESPALTAAQQEARILAAEVRRLQALLAEANTAREIQTNNYLRLCEAITGGGTFVCEIDPIEMVQELKAAFTQSRESERKLAEEVLSAKYVQENIREDSPLMWGRFSDAIAAAEQMLAETQLKEEQTETGSTEESLSDAFNALQPEEETERHD
jgi:hypothetical protein